MTVPEILAQVNDIFKDVFEDDNLIINESTSSNDIPEWDSLNHIQLVVSIEKSFKIRFKASEIAGFNNVGEMCEGIQKKLA